MENGEEKFTKCREDAEKYYKMLTTVWCPYLQDSVHFNVEGFEHLLFKSWNKNRTQIEQYTRLRLLRFAPEIISKSHTLQEYDERSILVRQKINSRWERRMKNVQYYIFVAIIKSVRLKIVVKEIEGGNKFFYSLYPSWRIEEQTNGNKKKVFYSGNPEED
ncbi:MAG: hypothetical protein Q8Q94_00815 [bacterium]|nr:hypothetical protein [bacterium]